MDERIRERQTSYGTSKLLETDRSAYTYYDCKRRLDASVRQMMRWFSRTLRTRTEWNDADMRKSDIRDLRWVLDDLTRYVALIERELDKIEGVNRTEERIRALRDVTGRTPEEAAAYLQKADELERSLQR